MFIDQYTLEAELTIGNEAGEVSTNFELKGLPLEAIQKVCRENISHILAYLKTQLPST